MKKIFDYESKFMGRVSQIGELVWLNLLWLLFSLPIITIGASTCAMYSVCYGLHEQENVSAWTAFIRAFRRDFWKATISWVVLALSGAGITFFCIYLIHTKENSVFSWIAFIIVAVVWLIPATYMIPLVARFENTISATIRNCYVLYLTIFPRSLLASVLTLLPLSMFLSAKVFVCTVLLWGMAGMAASAYFNSQNCLRIFETYSSMHPQGDTDKSTEIAEK